MGCNFNTMTLPGSLTTSEVEERFEKAQDDDRYENGHSYSGGFGMADGLRFSSNRFDNEDAAADWLDRHAEKWGEAIAVRFVDGNTEQWMIGANCAS